MVPTAQTQCCQATNYIGDNIVEIKFPVIGYEVLEEFRTNTEDTGANNQSYVEVASSRGIEDPVEASCEYEKGDAVEKFVGYEDVDLERGESSISCCCGQEEESSCERQPDSHSEEQTRSWEGSGTFLQ